MGYGSMASSGTTGHRVRGKKMGWGVAVIVGNITVRKQISGGGSRGHMSNGCAGWRRRHHSEPRSENGELTSAGSGTVSSNLPEVTGSFISCSISWRSFPQYSTSFVASIFPYTLAARKASDFASSSLRSLRQILACSSIARPRRYELLIACDFAVSM